MNVVMIKDKITVRVETCFKALYKDQTTSFRQKCRQAREMIVQIYGDLELCGTENLIKRANYLRNVANLAHTLCVSVGTGILSGFVVYMVTVFMNGTAGLQTLVSGLVVTLLGLLIIGVVVQYFMKSSVQDMMKADAYYTKKFELGIIDQRLETMIQNTPLSESPAYLSPLAAPMPSIPVSAPVSAPAGPSPSWEQEPIASETVPQEKSLEAESLTVCP